MKKGDTIYFSSEADEILSFNIKKKKIDGSYKYQSKNIFYRFFSFIIYRIIITPIFWIYFKLFNNVKIINKKNLKKVKGSYFIYANHTNKIGDAVCPTFMCFPKKPHIIVDADNVSLPFIGGIIKMCGALPLPSDIESSKNFTKAIKNINQEGNPIVIYPEAHLWPCYTNIRKFSNHSFRYPAELNSPIFTATTTYHKRKLSKKPRTEIYIDGPFYPDIDLDKQQKKNQLRNIAYNQMQERAKLNTYEYLKYVKRSTND